MDDRAWRGGRRRAESARSGEELWMARQHARGGPRTHARCEGGNRRIPVRHSRGGERAIDARDAGSLNVLSVPALLKRFDARTGAKALTDENGFAVVLGVIARSHAIPPDLIPSSS